MEGLVAEITEKKRNLTSGRRDFFRSVYLCVMEPGKAFTLL